MPERSVHCCITSPPYYGLRDYGVEGQIGLEETPAEFITRLVEVFREVRRALRDDGACWVNMGDSYAGSWGAQGRPQGNGQKSGRSAASARRINEHPRFQSGTNVRGREMGLKAKDLVGMPWRLAFALQADGWYLRQDIVWNKQNPMPEIIRDRYTKSHEYIFVLSKSARYCFDQTAILEPASPNTHARQSRRCGQGWSRRTTRTKIGSAHSQAVLTEQQVRKTHSRYRTGGVSQATLAAEYGASRSTANHIMTGGL